MSVGIVTDYINNLIAKQVDDNGIVVLVRPGRYLYDLLDFCFDDDALVMYRRFCRYYLAIDPEATASCVQAYREMREGGKCKK